MDFLVLQASGKEHEYHGKWCYHVQCMIDIWEEVYQVVLYNNSLFRPAAERFGKGLHPPKPAVNSVTTQTAQLPETSDAATDPSPTLPERTSCHPSCGTMRRAEDLREGRRPSGTTKAKAGAGGKGERECSTATGVAMEIGRCKEDISSSRLSYFFRTPSLVDHREGLHFHIFQGLCNQVAVLPLQEDFIKNQIILRT